MRIINAIVLLTLSFASILNAEVILKGELIIQDSFSGAKYLGEVINNNESSVTDVKVTVVAKDSTGKAIDVSSGYVDGYTEPEGWSDAFMPPGTTVPFYFFGDADADSIASYECTITYKESDKIFTELSTISNISSASNWLYTSYFGEITNISQKSLNYAKIIFAFKDADGNLIAVDFTYVKGNSHIPSEDTVIQPGQKAPFELLSMPFEEYASYYTIVNYWQKDEPYEQFGLDKIQFDGELSILNDNNEVRYVGYLGNDTVYDIYFVEVCIISRDIDGKIIDISTSYVEGTNYAYSETGTTDTHISPLDKAPFEVTTNAPFDKMATYEVRIYFNKSDTPSGVDDEIPTLFALKQNYPNPFNPYTTIEFSLSKGTSVELNIFNSVGQKAEVLVNTFLSAGEHSVRWDASAFPSGIYLYRIESGKTSESRKMLLVK